MNARRDKAKAQPQLHHQLAAQEEQRRLREIRANQQEADRKLAGKLGDFSFDVAKLIIAGAILGGIMKEDINNMLLISLAAFVTLGFVLLGIALFKRANYKEVEV